MTVDGVEDQLVLPGSEVSLCVWSRRRGKSGSRDSSPAGGSAAMKKENLEAACARCRKEMYALDNLLSESG